MKNIFSRIPYAITSDSYEELQKYDRDSRKRIIILGNFVLIPTLLWFITGYLVSSQLLDMLWYKSLIAGIVLALIIFLFEKSIVQSRKINWFVGLSRIILGVSIALISSAILDLVIFRNDIQFFARDEKVEERISEINQAISQQQNVVGQAQSAKDKTLSDFNNEMNGGAGTGYRGYGAVAKQKKATYVSAVGKLNFEEYRLDSLQRVKSKYSNPSYRPDESSLGMNTILNRLTLLHGFVKKHRLAMIAWILLFVIGIFLELFCIITKWGNSKIKTRYELDQEALDTIHDNKRAEILERSNYYKNMGVLGREAEQNLDGSKIHLLN